MKLNQKDGVNLKMSSNKRIHIYQCPKCKKTMTNAYAVNGEWLCYGCASEHHRNERITWTGNNK